MVIENFDTRFNVESPQFILEFRKKMAQRLRESSPLGEAGASSLPDQVESHDKQFPSNSWVGDVFAHISGQYRLKEGDIEKLRKIILLD